MRVTHFSCVKLLISDQVRLHRSPAVGILGSGGMVSQLAQEGLIDEYQVVVNPMVLGEGRTMLDGGKQKLNVTLTKKRGFGNVVLWYEPMP